ncbi:MAG: HAMP domain-containing histidine kinase [Bacteroidetes bacterium]|nr:HAMP domain-containing histidine kinase [Bacteroidota bacterium]MBU1372859.1 HAMP domain-containing histidine kinase [Bacteroidota bacterium]MBU1485588.1 HAMP domain-containing histidine kinase [Bacteroidota bacterium]MBU1759312.1 HAMP domain-containing histidine kinase [Bacteroidota bacterium]MBU2045193.1 HAMP domain-containing histidine kinase [Bacteroidota bacterium]
MLKNYQWRILIRVLLQLVTLSAAAFLLVKGWYIYLIILVPILIYQLVDFFRFHQKAQEEVDQFVESVHYRDFSRYFNVKQAPRELQPLRKGFNEINSTFKVISRERETQYVYLQKILELVDTGILSYKISSGEVVWLNESLKNLLGVPYLKTINSLQKRAADVFNECISIKTGENRIITINKENASIKVVISATAFQTEGEVFKLIAFQNVNEALDETEAKAWQRLLSVMTHEIMNSIAPISSLASTLKERLSKVSKEANNDGQLDDLEIGIETIQRRSDGLLKFAETYRNLNKITQPNLKRILVRDLFENLHQLMEPTFEKKAIELDIILKDPNITIEADMHLVEQVLINLVLNAAEAVKDIPEPRISLSAHIELNKTILKVADNGTGIPHEVLDQIFIPFFSTRKNGSGIGLSLSRQIMLLHKGNIQVRSKIGEGTAFLLVF